MKIIISERQYSFISEQPDSKMPFQIEKFGYNPSKPNTMGPALKKQQEVFNDIAKYKIAELVIGDIFSWIAICYL